MDSVPRAISNIHYPNGFLKLLRGQEMGLSGGRTATFEEEANETPAWSFWSTYFGALKEVLQEHFSLSRAGLSPGWSDN